MGNIQRLIVAISGASGAVYGLKTLEALKSLGVESHLIISRAAALSLSAELDMSVTDLQSKADVVYKVGDIGAAIASGSFRTLGMLVAPCSIKTLGEITTGVTFSLISRAADVTLKERRRLVLMVRESPLHLGHLRSMAAVTEMGAIVAPPMPAFYTRPKNLDEMVEQSVGRVLDLFGLDAGFKRWGEDVSLNPLMNKVANFWDWAVNAYAGEGIAALCLELQDDQDQCVPLLLWAVWQGVTARRVEADQAEEAADVARAWHESIIQPLRGIRKKLKYPLSDIEDEARLRIRTQVQGLELASERELMVAFDEMVVCKNDVKNQSTKVLCEANLIACAKAWHGRVPRPHLISWVEALSAGGFLEYTTAS